jgi:hypothetical protein
MFCPNLSQILRQFRTRQAGPLRQSPSAPLLDMDAILRSDEPAHASEEKLFDRGDAQESSPARCRRFM